AEGLSNAGVPWLDLHRRSSGLWDPRPVVALTRYLRLERIDLVHTHLRYANIVGRLAAALARRPAGSTIPIGVFGAHPLVQPGVGWPAAVTRQLDYLTAHRLATAIITVSQAQREAYLKVAGVESGRVVTLFNGVDLNHFRPNPEARARVRAELGIAPL